MLLLRRGRVAARSIATLRADKRLELFVADELSGDTLSFAQRVAVTIIATEEDPVAALAFVATAGMSGPFVLLASPRHARERKAVLDAGAIAFLTMPVSRAAITRLLPRIHGKSRVAHVDPALRLMLDPIGRVARYRNRSVRLSQREFAVLHCLSARGGKPVAADELTRVVWGSASADASARQILAVYVFQLRRKLRSLGLDDVISTVRQFGYALSVARPR